MNRIKKCLIVVLALCLITASTINCFAIEEVVGPVKFSISEATASAGDTFMVKISVAGNVEIDHLYVLEFKYDESCVEYIGAITDSTLIKSCATPNDAYDADTKTLTLGYEPSIIPNGELISYEFRVKPGCKAMNTEISFQCLATSNRETVTSQMMSAVITITCPHANKTSVAEVPATCMSTGTKAHEKCSACGKLFLDGKEVTEAKISTSKDPKNHEGRTEIRGYKPATEGKEGYTGDTYCLGCNQKIKDGIIIPPPDHTHTMTHTAPTAPQCTVDGVLEHWTCSKCGKIYADEAGTVELESTVDPKPGHKTEVKNAKEANCTEAGYTGDEICTVCNETVSKGTEIPPKGHTTEKVGAENANCSEYGYTGDEVCTVCNKTINKGEAIPPTGEHEEVVRDAKEADCTNEGYTGDTYCKNCGNKLKDGEIIPPNDTFHRSIEHHEKVAATCINTGTCEYWHCSDCGKNYSDEAGTLKIEKAEDLVLPIDPNNHVNTEIRGVKSATCSAEGYTGDKYCTDCNTLIASGSTLAINPDGHSFVNNKCEYCGKIQATYYPPTFTYIDDETHLAGGNIRSHVPDSLTMHTDGVYEWNYCLYCQHEYGRVPVAEVDINIDDSVDLIVDDPVQSTDDGDDIDVDVTEPEDNNPSTGMAIALLPMALAAAAASLVRKK